MWRYTAVLLVGIDESERPEPGQFGRLFLALDTGRFWLDAGTRWVGHAFGPTIAAVVTAPLQIVNMWGAGANTWTPVYPDFESEAVDFTDRKEYRVTASWIPKSSATQDLRWVSGQEVLHTFTGLTGTGTKAIARDSGWLPLPEWAVGEQPLQWQCRSTNAADDPYAIGWQLKVR